MSALTWLTQPQWCPATQTGISEQFDDVGALVDHASIVSGREAGSSCPSGDDALRVGAASMVSSQEGRNQFE